LPESFRVARLDEIEPIAVAGVSWLPLRRSLGVTAFGVNAYRANSGEHVVEPHDETGSAAGKHEEIYLVVHGRAAFTVAGEEIDAPAGTLVFVHERAARREATALEDGTTVVVAGGEAGTITPSAWEHYFAAEPAYDAGDYERAIEIASAGLADHPENVSLLYQLACYHALAGKREQALDFLRRAANADAEKVRAWVAVDSDVDSIRDDPAFPV
jgi:tetratricopeptide (TPR) repeat protein